MLLCGRYAVLGQTLLVLALPVVLGQTPSVSSDGTPEVKVCGRTDPCTSRCFPDLEPASKEAMHGAYLPELRILP